MSFFEEYSAGHIVLPHEILKNFHKLFSNELEFTVWLFFYENPDVAPSFIAESLNRNLSEINQTIKLLQEQGTLKVTILNQGGTVETIFDATYAFSKLDEIIARNSTSSSQAVLPQVEIEEEVSTDKIQELMNDFEQEMGVITPYQAEEIRNWVQEDKFEIGLIKLALKEAVLNRKVSLNYIRAILRNWRNEGVKSENDIQKRNEERQAVENKTVTPSFHIPTGQWKKNN